ncbi:hypothetical protein ACFLZ4_01645 [Patescibacteria group bacterium]
MIGNIIITKDKFHVLDARAEVPTLIYWDIYGPTQKNVEITAEIPINNPENEVGVSFTAILEARLSARTHGAALRKDTLCDGDDKYESVMCSDVVSPLIGLLRKNDDVEERLREILKRHVLNKYSKAKGKGSKDYTAKVTKIDLPKHKPTMRLGNETGHYLSTDILIEGGCVITPQPVS